MSARSLAGVALLGLVFAAAPPAHAADAVTPGHHRLAVAANTSGLRFYRSGQLPRAAMRFRDALALDPGYVLAHYNLACVGSRLRDVHTALAELRWLSASADPLAKTKLAKAAVDPDLDFVSALPEARQLLGLVPFDPAQPLVWLAERRGTWAAELPIEECSARSYTFGFHRDGNASMTVRESCDGAPLRARTFHATTRVTPDGVVHVDVADWPLWPSGVRLAFARCPGLDGDASCFTLSTDDNELGPFHRGVAGISPITLAAGHRYAR